MTKITLKQAVHSVWCGVSLMPGRPYPAKQESSDRWLVWPSPTSNLVVIVSDKNILHVLDID